MLVHPKHDRRLGEWTPRALTPAQRLRTLRTRTRQAGPRVGRWSSLSARCFNARTRASGSLARDWHALTVTSETGGSVLDIDMTYPEVASIFGLLDKWRHLPAYQLERRADIFFALFLPDVLNRHLSQRGIAIDPRLVPEFPLKRREDNGSKKADYLALSTDHEHAFLIELKTDSASLDKDQFHYLEDAVHRGMHELLRDLKCIVKATEACKRGKYFHLLKALSDLGLIRLPPSLKKRIFSPSRGPYKRIVDEIKIVSVPDSLEIIYVLPTATAGFEGIDFGTFAETIEDWGEIGRVFAHYLRSWAAIEAGAQEGRCGSHSE